MAKNRPNKELSIYNSNIINNSKNLPSTNGDLYGVFLNIDGVFNSEGLEAISSNKLNRDELMQLLDYVTRLYADNIGLKKETYNEVVDAIDKAYKSIADNE